MAFLLMFLTFLYNSLYIKYPKRSEKVSINDIKYVSTQHKLGKNHFYKSSKLFRSLLESDLKKEGDNPVTCLNCLDKWATLE